MAVLEPTAQLGSLHGADGSATYSAGGYTILGSVNGPIEVQRRDEIPEEAAVEVIVRPAVGVGTPKDRHLESILHSLLRSVILVRQHPRSLIQITLQVLSQPAESVESMRPTQSSSPLPLLPHLLQTALLALLSAALPLSTTYTSLLIVIPSTSSTSTSPSTPPTPHAHPPPSTIHIASSLHVFAFSTHGACLVSESSGAFSMAEYTAAYTLARGLCAERGDADAGGRSRAEGDDCMEIEGEGERDVEGQKQVGKSGNMTTFVRGVVQAHARREQRWRE